MHKILLLILVMFVWHAAGAAPSKDSPIVWKTPDKHELLAHDRPTLLYFGAEWCPPCRVLEQEIFNQADVQAAMSPFAAVFVDGDQDESQRLMQQFSVIGFPTLLALAPDGEEAGRYMGYAKKDKFLQFLSVAAEPMSPVAVLEKFQRGKSLSQSEWSALASLEVVDAALWQYEEGGGVEKLKKLRDGLAQAVAGMGRAERPLPDQVANRLRLKSMVLDVVAKDTTAMASHAKALDQILNDPAATSDLINELSYSEEILNYLHPDDTTEKRVLANRLIKMVKAQIDLTTSNAPLQIDMMQLELALLPYGNDSVDAAKTAFSERVEALLKEASTPADRLAMIIGAARLLRLSGREFRAEAVLRETLASSPEASYLHDGLAGFAQRRGDMDQYVQHSEASFRGGSRPSSSVTLGIEWINALIARNPDDSATIERAIDEVMTLAVASGQAFLGGRAAWMSAFATSLGQWASTTDESTGTKQRLLTRFSRLCESVEHDKTQSKACAESSELVRNPPDEEKAG